MTPCDDHELALAPQAAATECALQPTVAGQEGEEAPGTVWIVDDDSDAREQIELAARQCGALVRSFRDVPQFLREFRSNGTACLIVDAQLPDGTGLSLQRELSARYCAMPLIMTLSRPEVALVVRLVRAGAFDALEKPLQRERLVQCISAALESDRARQRAHRADEDIRQRLNVLTRRERQVLELLVTGLTSREMAEQLHICERTIEIYRSRIKAKMHARNAADLVRKMNLTVNPAGSDHTPGVAVQG